MIAFLADLHLGVKLPQIDFLKSLDKFFGCIKEHDEECHAIIVAGDLFDKKLSVDEAKFASIFLMNLVCNNCGRSRTHVPVYFVHGTYSHDNEQYEIFLPMLNEIPNVEVHYFKDTAIGTLHNGMSVLFLPQLYGDVDYTEAFSRHYDLIVGHGPISSLSYEPCNSTEYEILHSAEKLGEISTLCVFGHFHGYTDFGNGVYYTGPWLRWKYGEDTPRVFFFCNDNLEVKTVPNDVALEFVTKHVYSCDELRSEISSKEITSPHRFIIHCNNNNELLEYHAIMNAYKKNQFLKYQIISSKNNDDTEELLNASLKNDDNTNIVVEPIPALIEYVKDKYSVDAANEIHEYENKINDSIKKDVD